MKLSLSDKVKDLRSSIENNKLIIFVGAGVSQNSGIPTWGGLINEFARKMKYDKCKKCTHSKKGCKLHYCQYRYDFTQDEFLKIPQYFYNNDKSKGHKKYQKLIVDTLKSDNKSNPLNDMIMTLLPKHIITTNYDKLLENSKNPNTTLYDIIVEDKDLLTHNSNNYIIKMHGDIDKPETIVLKEDDYINYQQEHILIETYIKSLLVDHSFLFIGYSLNDYNLKLILGWIQYLAKEHSVNGKRPKNYIIQVQNAPIQKHIEKYFESNNIFILNTHDLPKEIIEKYKDIDLPIPGKEVYAALNYIYDESNDYLFDSLPEILFKKYKEFDAFKRISFEDLLSVYSFGYTQNNGGNLYFYRPEEFMKLKLIIQSAEKKEQFIKQVFLKAGISEIQYKEDFISFKEEEENNLTIDDKLFELYLNNEYFKIIDMLDNTVKDDNLICYYYYLILPHTGNLNIKLDEIEKTFNFKNKLDFIIYKYNRILFKQLTFKSITEDCKEFDNIISNLPKQYKKYYHIFEKLQNNMSENRLKCLNLFSEHEQQLLRKNNSITFGKPLGNLPELQSLAYDYYFFFKFNNLMLDYFSNPNTYFEPYIKAILCTFSPQKERSINNLWGFESYQKEYRLNSIDFDMMVKYTDNKLLKLWISEYNVKKIEFEDNVNVVNKFANLCNSMKVFGHRFNNVHLSNILFIVSKCNFTDVDKEKIISALENIIQRDGDEVNGIIVNIFEDVEYIINFYRDETIASLNKLLYTLLHHDTIKLINDRYRMHLSIVFRNLLKYSDATVHDIVDILINSQNTTPEKLEMIFILHHLFSETQKFNYMNLVKENISLINSEYLFRYILDKYISFDDTIQQRFLDIIEKEIMTKKADPSVHSLPDWLALTLEYCIILHLVQIWNNIDCLRPFAVYSDSLAFILDPENFDYTKIDTSNYMWTNMFRSKDYQNVLISHKNEIITLELKKALENGYATDDQKKILYKYLLSEEELWNLN